MFNNEMLFTQALNIGKPWTVSKVSFEKDAGELHIYIDFKQGSEFKCKKCGKEGLKSYDTIEKTWRHLNFFQHKAFIHCRTPRSNCPEDGPLMVDVPWARAGSGFTLLFEAFVMELAMNMSIKQTATIVDEYDTRIWRIINHYVEDAREKENYFGVRKIGLDETSCRKGHDYVTLFVDMEQSKVLYVTEGKDSSTIEKFKIDFLNHGGISSMVTDFSSDMSPSFIKGIRERFRWANITFDKFHVMKLMNKALDDVRRQEQRENPILKKTRFIWLKNFCNLNSKQSKQLENLSQLNLKTGKAYRIKLALQDIYSSCIDKNEAMQKLKKWYQWAVRSRIEAVKYMATTLKDNWNGIINYFDSKLTNGLLEGINSLVQSVKSRARGFRTTKNFITMIYLIAGKLTYNFSL